MGSTGQLGGSAALQGEGRKRSNPESLPGIRSGLGEVIELGVIASCGRAEGDTRETCEHGNGKTIR
jgi:hypothetical protein